MTPRVLVVPLLCAAWAVAAGCANTSDLVGALGEPPGSGGFVDPGAGADASLPDGAESTLMCVATECPAPYLTCPSDDGPTYTCAVDPRRDSDHCGGCNQACPSFPLLNMRSRCADGKCVLECVSVPRLDGPNEAPTDYRNCNGVDDDGCEADLLLDEGNCGSCGNACAPGVRCIHGKCGCPPGFGACGEDCVDLRTSDAHCSACFAACPYVEACEPMPPGTEFGCVQGECEKMKCSPGFADCDGDLGQGCASNGCEVFVQDDPQNCGACGVTCKADETCRSNGGSVACVPLCETSNLRTCLGRCIDTLTDPDHCGGCDAPCPVGGPNTQRSCEKGICRLDCAPGFGDCNGDASDGCETNLLVHPAHCGACGSRCDTAAGQPCVEGKCLERPCDPSEAR